MLHAHTYFPYVTTDDKLKADKFHAAVQSQLAGMDGVKISDISRDAVGPHPMPQFETAFTKYCLQDVLPWLIFNRPNDFSILVHPFTSDVVSHSRHVQIRLKARLASVVDGRQYPSVHTHVCIFAMSAWLSLPCISCVCVILVIYGVFGKFI